MVRKVIGQRYIPITIAVASYPPPPPTSDFHNMPYASAGREWRYIEGGGDIPRRSDQDDTICGNTYGMTNKRAISISRAI